MWRDARLMGFAAILCLAGCGPEKSSDPLDRGQEGDEVARTEGEEDELTSTMPRDRSETAKARIEGRSGSNLSGEATFAQQDGAVQLVVSLSNLDPGPHAVHIHEVGDCSAPDASSAGKHWNPRGEPHGKRGSESYHLGDIGNVEVGSDGTGSISLTAEDWSLVAGGGDDDPVGKAIVIHAKADDFETQPDGGGGEKIGCGVIQREAEASTPATEP